MRRARSRDAWARRAKPRARETEPQSTTDRFCDRGNPLLSELGGPALLEAWRELLQSTVGTLRLCHGRLEQPVLMRPAARLGSVGDAELAIDVREVKLDRLLGHPQLSRHPAVRQTPGNEPQDLTLAPGQSRCLSLQFDRGACGLWRTRDVTRALEHLPNRR